MKLLKNIFITFITTTLFIIFPFIVFTLITSKTTVLGNIRSFVVLSGSMQPLFPVGSVVYSQKSSQYNKGDIITYSNKADEFVTHRIVGMKTTNNKTTYITQGDTNKIPDSIPVSQEKITGKVFFFMPHLGILIIKLKSPIYFISFLIIPAIIFIGIELWNIKREIEKNTEKRILERLHKQNS